MSIFFIILLKLIPLYLIIALGYIAARVLKAQKETIAKLLIYVIAPAAVFYGSYTIEINPANLSLPILFFVICSLMALLFLFIDNLVFKKDITKNILAFTAGTGNAGYFGLPVVLALFGDQAFALTVMAVLGFILYGNSVGYFLMAKSNHSNRKCLLKLLKIPTIYVFFLGLALNYWHLNLGGIAITALEQFKGAYTLLGMLIVGMGLATVKMAHIDYKFISLSFLAKFIVWPLVIGGIIVLDRLYIHAYNPQIYNIFILMAITPLAANTVVFATELNVHPDKVSLAVFVSTIFALFYIPLVMGVMDGV